MQRPRSVTSEHLAWLHRREGQPLRLALRRDPVVESWGHAVTSHYVETMWLPIIGPSALFMARRLVDWAEDGVTEFLLDELGACLGLPRGKVKAQRTLVRLFVYRFAERLPDDSGVAVRPIVGPVPPRLVDRLPGSLRPVEVG